MTIKQFLAALGITNIDKEVEIKEEPKPENPSSINEQQQQQQQQQPPQQQQQQQKQEPEVDPQIAALQKEINDLKAVNARLLTQTPVEHQQTADEALLELLGIGGNENNGTDESTNR